MGTTSWASNAFSRHPVRNIPHQWVWLFRAYPKKKWFTFHLGVKRQKQVMKEKHKGQTTFSNKGAADSWWAWQGFFEPGKVGNHWSTVRQTCKMYKAKDFYLRIYNSLNLRNQPENFTKSSNIRSNKNMKRLPQFRERAPSCKDGDSVIFLLPHRRLTCALWRSVKPS